MRPFSIIVAVDSKLGIGKGGALPWHLPEDLKHFKTITTQVSSPYKKNVVIMGRKTWESLPAHFRPLPGRINIILSRDAAFAVPQGVYQSQGIENALQLLETKNFQSMVDQVFIIGGGQIFFEALKFPQCQKLFFTHIQKDFACDTFFSSITHDFKEIDRTPLQSSKNLSYYFAEYHKK
jgi:dihydrofolate reductase/thymidylate synthase